MCSKFDNSQVPVASLVWDVDVEKAHRRLVLREQLDGLVETVHEMVDEDIAAGK